MAFQRILVPVVGTEADREAIRLGCKLGKKDKAKECVDRMLKLEPDWTKYVDKYMPKLK